MKWMTGDNLPKRPGVYRRKYSSGERFSKWNGEHWSNGHRTIEEASRDNGYGFQGKPWWSTPVSSARASGKDKRVLL